MTHAATRKNERVTLGSIPREIVGVVLFILAAFLLVSFASYAERGTGGSTASTSNLCGSAGYAAARIGLFWFGYAAYLGVVIVFTWSLALIARRPLLLSPFRLLWFGMFLFCSAALLSHFGVPDSMRIPDPGGLVGYQIAAFLDASVGLGVWGTKLVLLMLVLVTFQLASDFAIYNAIVALYEFIGRRREDAAKAVRTAGPLFHSLLKAREATRSQASRAPTRAKPKQVATIAAPVEIAVTDEEVEGFGAEDAGGTALPPRHRSRLDKHGPIPVDDDVDDEDDDDFPIPAVVDVGEEDEGAAHVEGMEGIGGAAGVDSPDDDEPAMLDHDPDSEVVPEPEAAAKRAQATIHFDPPKTAPVRAAAFDRESTVYEAPPEVREYRFPSIHLLEEAKRVEPREFQKMVEQNIEVLESALASYKVEAEVVEIQKGPVITMFELNVAPGTRLGRIRALEDDLAIRLKARSVRIVAPIPGKSTIGIEVPNSIRETVCLRELVTAPEYQSSNFAIPVFIGKDASGRPLIEDLAKMPHVLIAGATGAGKSVCLNTLIMSIIFTRTPDQVKMIMIDPKMVELSSFESIPHLMCPVVRDMNRAAQILEWAVAKMDERYSMLAEVGARNIFSYNKMSAEEKRAKLNVPEDDDEFEDRMPFIVLVVDELADLMMVSAKEVENYITRLAQKSRAVGIHIVLATQRPSTNVITGLIKANMPTRISFQVASKIDSRVVLDHNGAEKLLGFGDMLYMPPRTSSLVRAQGGFVTDEEIKAVVDAVKTDQPQFARELIQKNQRSAVDPREADSLYEEAARFIVETRRGSASLLQRKFAIGYTRASRLIDLMADDGILGEFRNAQAREVMITLEEFEQRLLADPSSS